MRRGRRRTHMATFLDALLQALTNALACFTTENNVNKSLRLHIYTVNEIGADTQLRCWGSGGISFDALGLFKEQTQ